MVLKKKKKSKILRSGTIQYPVRGEIVSNYGEGKDVRKSKNGVVFKVSQDSFVTSPINGMVVYANQFRSYGNLVIIENNEGDVVKLENWGLMNLSYLIKKNKKGKGKKKWMRLQSLHDVRNV